MAPSSSSTAAPGRSVDLVVVRLRDYLALADQVSVRAEQAAGALQQPVGAYREAQGLSAAASRLAQEVRAARSALDASADHEVLTIRCEALTCAVTAVRTAAADIGTVSRTRSARQTDAA